MLFVIAKMDEVHPHGDLIKNNCAKSFKEHAVSGCKESQFYSFPFWQVVAGMYYPKTLLSSQKIYLMSSIDYSSSVI